jgi:hypothetical protein
MVQQGTDPSHPYLEASALACCCLLRSDQSSPDCVSVSTLWVTDMVFTIWARLDSWLKYCSPCSPTL